LLINQVVAQSQCPRSAYSLRCDFIGLTQDACIALMLMVSHAITNVINAATAIVQYEIEITGYSFTLFTL